MAFRSAEGLPDLDAAVVVGYVSVAAAGRIAAEECAVASIRVRVVVESHLTREAHYWVSKLYRRMQIDLVTQRDYVAIPRRTTFGKVGRPVQMIMGT